VADPAAGAYSGREDALRPNRRRIDAAAFADVRIVCGLDVDRAARLLHVAPRTVRRWESGRCRVPYAAFRLLRLMSAGRVLSGPWREFSVRGDTLWTPEGKAFKAPELGYLWLTFAMARRWQADYAERGRLDRCLPRGMDSGMMLMSGSSATAANGERSEPRRPSPLSPRPVTRGEKTERAKNDINLISEGSR
jgi:hypothetical protein